MTASLLPLRRYQRECIDALYDDWKTLDRLGAVLPTGAGKTVIFSHLSREHHATHGGRVLILAHTDELVQQAAKKMRQIAPHLSIGIVKGARREVNADVIVASVQSLRTPAGRAMLRGVTLIICDEAHHATARTYREILKHFPGVKVAGFTATMVRGDNESLGEIWQKVSYSKSISYMIRSGHLIDVAGKRVEIADFDLKSVARRGGDYVPSALTEALEASLAPSIVAAAYVEHASDRSGILFAPTVDAADTFAENLNQVGVVTEVVSADTNPNERRAILARLEDGTTQVVANCMVLSEGFDSPRVSCVVIARPTRSRGLYQQMVGRALRPDPSLPYDQQQALILDVVGASAVNGLASLIDLSPKRVVYSDGTSLTEMEDGENPFATEKPVHDGPVIVVDFDPLTKASKKVWLKTSGGIYFLGAGKAKEEGIYVFLVPTAEPGMYDVAWCTMLCRQPGQSGGITEHTALPIEVAMSWGEEEADERGPAGSVMTLSRMARWRTKEPSDAQRNICRSLRIDIPVGAKQDVVSDLISIALATKRIDPIITKLRSN